VTEAAAAAAAAATTTTTTTTTTITTTTATLPPVSLSPSTTIATFDNTVAYHFTLQLCRIDQS
ncbi:hypothetical protein WUBG_06775, partial [Wuchereria bancrofti]